MLCFEVRKSALHCHVFGYSEPQTFALSENTLGKTAVQYSLAKGRVVSVVWLLVRGW